MLVDVVQTFGIAHDVYAVGPELETCARIAKSVRVIRSGEGDRVRGAKSSGKASLCEGQSVMA